MVIQSLESTPQLLFTLCFITCEDNILMLNRQFPPWMGKWNGLGGKIEQKETPRKSVIREVCEESGLLLRSVIEKGVVRWLVDGMETGGMYLYLASMPTNQFVKTPGKMREGILDWKQTSWILHRENRGVADNVPYFLPKVLYDTRRYQHFCYYRDGMIADFRSVPMS